MVNAGDALSDPAVKRWLASADQLPVGDYVSPGLTLVTPDAAFPNMVLGDERTQPWPHLRRDISHNWYVDRRNPTVGFLDRDEAAILFNAAALFRGVPCLEIGCWRGWSSAHLALAAGNLEIIDPVLEDPVFAEDVRASLARTGVADRVVLHAESSPDAVLRMARDEHKRWSFIFIDGDHEGSAPFRDAEAVREAATPTAMIMFHDLSSPDVAHGLLHLREQGWKTKIYHTKQIMGVAWRGVVEPPDHTPNPSQSWTLPPHLAWWADGAPGARTTVAVESGPAGAPNRQADVTMIAELTQLSETLQQERDRYVAQCAQVEAQLQQAQHALHGANADVDVRTIERDHAQARARDLEERVSRLAGDLRSHNETTSKLADSLRDAARHAEHAENLERQLQQTVRQLEIVTDALQVEKRRVLSTTLRSRLAEEALEDVELDLENAMRREREIEARLQAKIDAFGDVDADLMAALQRERNTEAGLQAKADALDRVEADLVAALQGQRDIEARTRAETESIWRERQGFETELLREREQTADLRQTLQAVWASSSWRATHPLRALLIRLGRR